MSSPDINGLTTRFGSFEGEPIAVESPFGVWRYTANGSGLVVDHVVVEATSKGGNTRWFKETPLQIVGAYTVSAPADGTAPRTSTQWIQGDIAIVDQPTSSGINHWRCVQSGPGAVWVSTPVSTTSGGTSLGTISALKMGLFTP